jgi:hypothetical protein
MTAAEKTALNAKLVDAIAHACIAALEAGLSPDDVMVILYRAQELIDVRKEK